MSSRQWTVMCRDVAGRERPLRVVVRGREVVIVAPPGESAALSPAGAQQLQQAVAAATEAAAIVAPRTPTHVGDDGGTAIASQHIDGLNQAVGRRVGPPTLHSHATARTAGLAAVAAVGGEGT